MIRKSAPIILSLLYLTFFIYIEYLRDLSHLNLYVLDFWPAFDNMLFVTSLVILATSLLFLLWGFIEFIINLLTQKPINEAKMKLIKATMNITILIISLIFYIEGGSSF